MQEQLISNDIIFTEAALIYEAEMENMFDYVVLITANNDVRMKSVMANGKLTEEDFKKETKTK